MRLLVLLGLFVVCVSFSPATASQGGAAQEADIGKSGTEFMRICSVGGAGSDWQRLQSGATCQGWVEGFADGFTGHEEGLGVPRSARLVGVPRYVTNAQMIT